MELLPEKTGKLKKLTPRQARFAEEYQKDFNGAQAAIRAGYSSKAAREQAYDLLALPHIQQAIQDASKKHLENIGISVERWLQEVARLAFVDERKLYNKNGKMLLPHEWDDDTAAAIAGLDVDEISIGTGKNKKPLGYTKKVKVHSKTAALELLGKYLKVLTDRVVFPDKNGEPQSVNILGDLERATRLAFLIEVAAKRKANSEEPA